MMKLIIYDRGFAVHNHTDGAFGIKWIFYHSIRIKTNSLEEVDEKNAFLFSKQQTPPTSYYVSNVFVDLENQSHLKMMIYYS